MSDVKMGIQLYTLRDYIQTAEEYDKTLAELEESGVDTIQISGIGPIPYEEIKQITEKHKMHVCVTHTNFDRMKAETDEVIREHKLINCDMLGIGSMPVEARHDLSSLREFIAQAHALGKKFKEHGMRFAYHNHDFEFKTVLEDGRTIMDVLLDETDPELFWFIPDVAWIQIGGKDPVEFLDKLNGRVKVCHFKDYYKADVERGFKFTELGKGEVDIKACLKKLREMQVPFAVYEHDIDWSINAMESCKESYKYMLKINEK